MCRSKKKSEKDLGAMDEEEGNLCNLNVSGWGRKRKITLPHTAYDRYKGWIASRPQGHPELPLQAAVCVSCYQQLTIPHHNVSHRRVEIKSFPDTGAQMTVVGMKLMHALGIKTSELIPLSRGVNAANNSKLGLLGEALVEFSGKNCDGEVRASKQLCYVAHDIDSVYMSRSACVELGLIGDNFPTIRAFMNPGKVNLMSENKAHKTYLSVNPHDKPSLIPGGSTCSCPKCKTPPPVPKELPFPAVAKNRERLRDWILDRFSLSAFNQCEHQPLPLMRDSPPPSSYMWTQGQSHMQSINLVKYQSIGETRSRLSWTGMSGLECWSKSLLGNLLIGAAHW